MTRINVLPELSDVLEWFMQSHDSLEHYQNHIEDLSNNNPGQLPSLYKGMEFDEFNEYFESLKAEISLLFIFYLISLTEGKIRVDFFDRVEENFADLVSKKYIAQYRKAGPSKAKEIRLESLMEIWKNYFRGNNAQVQIIGEFKNRMKTRHWIAHGRYWDYNSHDRYTVPNTFERCNELLNLIPFTY
jgi:hypothetical protein